MSSELIRDDDGHGADENDDDRDHDILHDGETIGEARSYTRSRPLGAYLGGTERRRDHDRAR
jgi:hypothetical protein